MRAGSLRSAPLAGLVSAHHAVHAGPCSVIGVASAWRKKLQTHKCGSAYPNCATCSRGCCGADGTALSTCCIGPSGEDAINSELCAATIESADRLCPHSIYNCSTRASSVADSSKETYPRDRASTPETDIAPWLPTRAVTSSPTKVATRLPVLFSVGFFFPLTGAESATYESHIRLNTSPYSQTQCDLGHIQA